ncbi:hypothetical protein GH714_036906 [Hevea brasiliensis]|uniref:Uncharacterized protein n=1 Tax=Hevea brasiliensis TaxID=3981 RepID=A0A6A6M8E1_HEVBR|nr:hypothetical protein GH714_036906 [Hevea brasiliensis]
MASDMFFSGDSLESPTSTLNFAENALAIPLVGFHHETSILPLQFPTCNITCKGGMDEDVSHSEHEWKCFEKSNQMALQLKETLGESIAVHEMTTYGSENAWIFDSFRVAPNDCIYGNIVEGLSDNIAYNSGDQNSSMAGENTTTTSESCGANLEDLQGNYWNSFTQFGVDSEMES